MTNLCFCIELGGGDHTNGRVGLNLFATDPIEQCFDLLFMNIKSRHSGNHCLTQLGYPKQGGNAPLGFRGQVMKIFHMHAMELDSRSLFLYCITGRRPQKIVTSDLIEQCSALYEH